MIFQTMVVGSYPLSPNREDIMRNYFMSVDFDPWQVIIRKVINDMLTAGIDILSDGQTRDPFVQLFARKLTGCRVRKRVEIIDDIQFREPITLDDQRYIRSHLPPHKHLKGVITGPYTLAQSCKDTYYHDKKEVAFAFAYALQKEVKGLQTSIDVLGIDEPFFSVSFPEYAHDLIKIINQDTSIPTILHVCGDVSPFFSKIIELPVDSLSHEFKARPQLFDVIQDFSFPQSLCIGCVRSDDTRIEPVEEIIVHINHSLDLFGEKIQYLSPDCGQRVLPYSIAYHKLENLVQAKEALNG
jgi:5-methyltetrahydropteroyltriglutamate--homocysteine methyltransferase